MSQSRNYQQQLHPWCIVRSLPNLERLIVAHCRRRGEVEAHLRLLRQQLVLAYFTIVFDLSPSSEEA